MIDRQKVYEKYDGRCAYCGNKIEFKKMQVDHLIPKALYSVKHDCLLVDARKFTDFNLNDFPNLMPSCRRCNHYKRAYTLEDFRHVMKTLHERVMKQYITKVAIDFGIVKIEPFNGSFYFEQVSIKEDK